jgi:glutathione S-transferase
VLRLITIPISHYCEKARWALDRARLPYREERHIQVAHVFAAKRAGGGQTVPVLVTPERTIAESAEIVSWANERMAEADRIFPTSVAERQEVEALCRRFDDRLGPTGRRLIYAHMVNDREVMLDVNNQGVPDWEDAALRRGFVPATALVCRVLGVRDGREVEDEAAVWAEFDFVADRLSDGRPYLCGERFTAADLTFAALSAPVTAPPEYGIPLPQPGADPPMRPVLADLMSRARAHPAGRFALTTYATQRSLPVVA